MTVAQLIELLQSVVRNDARVAELEVDLEGCDCSSDCDGLSIVDMHGGGRRVVLRVRDGAFDGDGEEVIKP